MDRYLNLAVAHSNCNDLARVKSSFAHFANHEPQLNRTKAASQSAGDLMSDLPWNLASVPPGATDPCDYPGGCYSNVL